MEKTIHIVPMVIDEITVSEEQAANIQPLYFYRSGEDFFYPAMMYDRAFIHVEEHRVDNIYIRRIGGVDHLFVNEMRLVPIRGIVYSILSNGRHIAIAAQLKEGGHVLTILEDKNPIFELYEVKTGFFSKKTCYPSRIDLGLVGERIYVAVRSRGSGGEKCNDLLIYEKTPDKYGIKQYKHLIPSGWNGEWYTYMIIGDKNIDIVVVDYKGGERKYRVPKTFIPGSFLIPGSVISIDKDYMLMNNSYELLMLDLKRREVLWRKTYENIIYTPRILSGENNKIVVYSGKRIEILDKETGNTILENTFDRDITASTLDRDEILIALNDTLLYYRIDGRELKRLGKYHIPGSINSLNKHSRHMLINYISPGKMTKLIYADYGDAITLDIPVFKLTTGSTTTYEFSEVTPTIRVLKKIGQMIHVFQESGKMLIADRGSKPGTYTGILEFDIPGFLPVVDEVKVVVEKLETAFKRIKIQPRIVPSNMGAYVPVIVEPAIDIDEAIFILRSRRGEIYGASHILHDVSGKRVIPIYILWAKEGIHDSEILITVWSRRNLLRERINTKIIAEYDIPPFYLRVSADSVRIWSPFNIEAARIKFESPGAEYTIIHDLRAGWNEIDTHGLIPEQVKITLRSGITYVVRRGSSWIQLSRS